MRYLLNFLCFIFLLTSCNKRELDYSKIDFETRKIIKDSWYDYDDLEMERIFEQENKKYKYYESQIKNYKKRVLSSLEYSDSLRNHKSAILDKFRQEQKAKKAKNSDSLKNQIDLSLEFDSPEEEYNFNKEFNDYNLKENNRKLDSLKGLYEQVNENDKYYKLKYLLKFNSDKPNKRKKQQLEILVDENSEIFDYQFLDIPRDIE